MKCEGVEVDFIPSVNCHLFSQKNALHEREAEGGDTIYFPVSKLCGDKMPKVALDTVPCAVAAVCRF